NELSVQGLIVTHNVSAVGGDDIDVIDLRNNSARIVTFDARGGNDSLSLRGNAVDQLFALLGDSDDEIFAEGNLVRGFSLA
ncbi:hypothetical protein, partial [Klebsiella pneumoniae]|uniref:hypothetical protein n=1 Tax=Klebsiella pneumoniae TaxID=573 RepID=UPI003F5208A7